MTNIPVNRPDSFGNARHNTGESPLQVVDVFQEAPQPDPHRTRPAVQRLLNADRANLICFHFAPGQSLPDHQAAHPITVQCLSGHVLFSCENRVIDLTPGKVIHLPAYVVHRVDCPLSDTDNQPGILLLTMLTPQDDRQ